MKIKYHKKKNQQTKRTIIHSSSYFYNKQLFAFLIVFIIAVIYLSAFFIYYTPFSPNSVIPETEKNSMKKIPADVKIMLKKQTPIASLSATLHVPILMYHYVEYLQNRTDTERQLLNVNPDIFEKQIETLLADGYTFITAKDLGDIFDGKIPLPTKPVLLTFDDGHWDLDTVVLPILKKYHIKATAYIVPGFIDTNSDSLTTKELQNLIDSGLIDVGAHTVMHVSLKGESLSKAKYEVNTSKTMLEQKYHIHVYSFAYPYGSFDQQTITLVKQVGFTTAASTIPGNNQSPQNRYFLFRVRPGYMTGKALLHYLNQVWPIYKR